MESPPSRGERYSGVLYKRRDRMCVMCGLTDFCETCFPGHSCCLFEPDRISRLAPADSQQQHCPTCTHALPIEGPWLRCTECPARVHEVRPFLDHEESCLLNCMWGCTRELCGPCEVRHEYHGCDGSSDEDGAVNRRRRRDAVSGSPLN